MPIRTKFLIVFFLTALLPLIFLGFISFNSAKSQLINATRQRLETIASLEISRIREVGMNPSLLKTITTNYSGLGSTGEVIVAKRGIDGKIIYITPRRFEQFAKNPSTLMEKALNKNEDFFPNAIDYRDKPELAVTRYIPELGWGIVVKIDMDEAFQSVNALRDIILTFSFIFLLVIVMVTLFFVHSLTAPILNLVSVAKQVQKGELSKRALVLSKDEIGELSTSFNTMVDALQKSHENLEKKVADRTSQLETSNKDLESFSYSVSHDLRAPLRSIDGFSKILEEDYATKLDDEGKRVVATIRNSTKQMGILIDDLLAFSRLGRQEVKAIDVDMTKLANTVFDEIKQGSPGRSIEFSCAQLPFAHADPILMKQVWVNLLSNAVKFTNKKDVAKISVGSNEEDDKNIYFVKDNGAGFDMKYVDKLFNVFQRLHSAQDFEGTGIGLSIVARIIKKHGGSIKAEATVDQGATFYFSLPKNQALS